MQDVWRFISQKLDQDQDLVVLLVAQHQGSTPGKRGFLMAIARDGQRAGTIGGGIMEHNLVNEAATWLQTNTKPELLIRIHRDKAPVEDRSGMICAGSQHILRFRLTPDDRSWITQHIQTSQQGQSGQLIISPKGVQYQTTTDPASSLKTGSEWHCTHPIPPTDTLWVIGSGHVGLAICKTFAMLDFNIAAFDHRPEVDTFVGNTTAHQKHTGPYEDLAHLVPEGQHIYAAVVTTAFHTDIAALRQLAPKNIRYLGLMGSTTKIKRIMDQLASEGIPKDRLKAIQAPLGIPLPNQTPAEIAISLAAQIIQIRNK